MTNQAWHAQNRMPKNPSLDQRVAWHLEHARHCGCRKMPESIAVEIAKRSQASEVETTGRSPLE